VTPEDVERGERMKALREALGLTQDALLGPDKRPQVVEAEKGRDRLRGQLLFLYAERLRIPIDALRAYAFNGAISLADLLKSRIPGTEVDLASPQKAAPSRALETGTNRDRLWLRTALEQAGIDRGTASDVALSIQFSGAQSPDDVLTSALGIARAIADPKRAAREAQAAPHPKEPPTVGGDVRKSRDAHDRKLTKLGDGFIESVRKPKPGRKTADK
jgi:transcriptional regulator with XRE-family HTH domain